MDVGLKSLVSARISVLSSLETKQMKWRKEVLLSLVKLLSVQHQKVVCYLIHPVELLHQKRHIQHVPSFLYQLLKVAKQLDSTSCTVTTVLGP